MTRFFVMIESIHDYSILSKPMAIGYRVQSISAVAISELKKNSDIFVNCLKILCPIYQMDEKKMLK